MTIRFERTPGISRLRLADGTELKRTLEVRRDPLLGYSSRIAEGIVLAKTAGQGLAALRSTEAGCPFCGERVERVTPVIPPEISPEPRIRIGETLVFPNLVPYSQYAAVAAFTSSHLFALTDFTRERLCDNLRAASEYVRRVSRHDAAAQYCGYSINYLFPSGGSLPHPHAQIFLDPQPTTMTRLELTAGREYFARQHRAYWDDLALEEERLAERWVGRIGRAAWFTPFAPLGFNQVNASVEGRRNLLECDDGDLRDLAEGVARVLRAYAATGYDSFNLAVYSGPLAGDDACRVHAASITRSALQPHYRSDAMYLERLHWEAAVDLTPEAVAGEVRRYF